MTQSKRWLVALVFAATVGVVVAVLVMFTALMVLLHA